MREIKFRLLLDNQIVGYLRLHSGWTQFQSVGETEWSYPCSFKWETADQYFGRKDTNGVEIYEGDILDPKYKWTVGFKQGQFIFTPNKKMRFKGLWELMKFRERAGIPIEVVSDVHTTPELLEKPCPKE